MTPIKVVIADDHLMVREGLRQLLDTQADIRVIGEAGDGVEALQVVRRERPDILILDISMPKMTGLQAIKMARDAVPDLGVVILSMYQKEMYVQQAFEAGARGYVLKGAPSSDLLEAIRKVHTGRYFLSYAVHAEVIQSFVSHGDTDPADEGLASLSERERQVFMLLIEGNGTAQVAELLCVSPKTVEKHRAAINRKLGVSNPVEMMKYAIRCGVVDPEVWKS